MIKTSRKKKNQQRRLQQLLPSLLNQRRRMTILLSRLSCLAMYSVLWIAATVCSASTMETASAAAALSSLQTNRSAACRLSTGTCARLRSMLLTHQHSRHLPPTKHNQRRSLKKKMSRCMKSTTKIRMRRSTGETTPLLAKLSIRKLRRILMRRNSPRIKQRPTMTTTKIKRTTITTSPRRLSTKSLAGPSMIKTTKRTMNSSEPAKASTTLTGADLTHWMTGVPSSTRERTQTMSTSITKAKWTMKMIFLRST